MQKRRMHAVFTEDLKPEIACHTLIFLPCAWCVNDCMNRDAPLLAATLPFRGPFSVFAMKTKGWRTCDAPVVT